MSSGSSSASVSGAFIVGCGPAGISIAYHLQRKGVPYVLVETEDCTVPLWRKYTYECLKLELPEEQCGPGDDYQKFLKNLDMVRYLDGCIKEYKIEHQLNEKVTFAKFDERNQFWEIVTELTKPGGPKTKKEYRAYTLVVATGLNSDARPSVLEGLNTFPESERIHSKNYTNAKRFKNKTVGVVGYGPSGMDISLDLKQEAKDVYAVVRDLENNVPKWITRYHLAEGQIHELNIFAMPEITGSNGNRVWYRNGKYIDTDALIFATGYEVKVSDWLKGGKFDEDGRPISWKDENNQLYYLGFHGTGMEGIKKYVIPIADKVYRTFHYKKKGVC